MRIIRYHNTPVFSPAANFPGLRDEMDRLFDEAFSATHSFQRRGFIGRGTNEFPIDLYRDKDSFIVRAELPGFRREDLNVEVADGILTVTGHHQLETRDENQKEGSTNGATTQERRVSRSISLPEQVKVDDIGAKYENGVLTVTLPTQEEAKPRQITIDVK